MLTRRRGLAAALAWVLIAPLWLGGCATPTLISAYDDQIDVGVTQILSDTTTFVNRMVSAAGSPAGGYAQNQDFYATQEGRIAALEARAEAHKVFGGCPTTSLIGRTVSAVGANPRIASDPQLKASFDRYSATLRDDDCEVVVLHQLSLELEDLKNFHAAQGAKGIPAVAADPILVGGMGATIRVVMAIEAAKKAAK